MALAQSLLTDRTPALKDSASFPDSYIIAIPNHLKRCGIELKLIVPHEDNPHAHSNSIQAIQQALSKALTWNQALLTGAVPSMTTLAKQENVTQRYIAHLIKLVFLAPDIMEAIIRGDIPSALSLDRLKKGFPFDWTEQRKVLGFIQ